jgi:sterol desaturase/sphingolipid hydroxylase (fatty acid hydroxylase superfamily)
LFQRRWFHRKIVQALPVRSDIRREIHWSLITLVIFGTVGTLTILAINNGWTQLYRHISDHSWGWWWASIGLTILLHDTWFYWTHRLMHHRKLFKFFHRTHHLSMNPSPWASFAFSPAEAVMQAAIFPLAVFLIPQHATAFGVFMVWQMTFNVIGHTGYEYNRPGLMRSWLRFIVNTPTNHAMHHEKIRGNYGLYFNFWDRLMGTNHKDYERRFLEVTTRPKPEKHSDLSSQPAEEIQQTDLPQYS